MSKKLILASASPRRKEILSTAGYRFEAMISYADEASGGLPAEELVAENAKLKALEILNREGNEDSVVLGADTVVCLNGKILGKPTDEADAFAMLKSLSSSIHEVLTGYCVADSESVIVGYCTSEVKFKPLSDGEINAYIATKEPLDKAGAYGIQERAGIFVEWIKGDYFNIMGLPISAVSGELKKKGIFPEWLKDV